MLSDRPLLGPEKVLQLFDSDLRSGDDVLLNSGTLKLLHLQTQLTQLNTAQTEAQVRDQIEHTADELPFSPLKASINVFFKPCH